MSTDYHLACHDCKEVVYLASRQVLGTSLGNDKLIPSFVIKHQGHFVDILREGDNILCDDLYKEWTDETIATLEMEDNYLPITSALIKE